MTADDQERADQLGRAWDADVAGLPETDTDVWAEIRMIRDLTAMPPPDPGLRRIIWQQVAGHQNLEALVLSPKAPCPNGVVKHPPVTLRKRAVHPPRDSAGLGLWRLVAIGGGAGFGGGFLAGIWTRGAMRVAGALTVDRNRGLLTENDAAVGALTLDGTLFLALAGAFAGIVFGVLYMSIRRWLPQNRRARAVTFGMLMLAVFGFILMDEHNPDYQRFGPAWLNVGTFSLTYVLFGMTVSFIAEALDRRIPRLSLSSSGRTRLVTLGISPFAALAVGSVMIVALTGMFDLTPAVILAVLGLIWLYRASGSSWAHNSLGVRAIARYGAYAVLVPCLFGFYLTLQGIFSILAG